MLKNIDRLFAVALLVVAMLAGSTGARLEAWPAVPGVYGLSTPPPATTCPKGLTYVAFDNCDLAEATAQFQDANLIATYALDTTGNPQTIYHSPPFNAAGIDFPVGQTTTSGKQDPRNFSIVGAANITGTNTVNWVRIDNLGVPQAGMTFWDRPSNGTQYYAVGNAPKFVSCTQNTGGFLYQCLLDRTVTNRSNFIAWASLWPGCVVGPANVVWNITTPATPAKAYDEIVCQFQNSANGMTAVIDNIEFGPIGGHGATVLSAGSTPNGSAQGFVQVNNSHLVWDATTAGNYILSSGTSPNIQLIFTNSECDGGNAGDPVAGPWTYNIFAGCFSWDSPGSTAFGRNQMLVRGIYAHDWTANPFSTNAGNTDTIFQNNVAIRVAMGCGDTAGSNGCHGTLNAWSTTLTGSSASLKMYNTTAVYPYGMRAGVNTGALSVQGGIGAGDEVDLDFKGATLIANTSNIPGNSSAGVIGRAGRVGKVSNLQLQHLYVNSHGFKSCFHVGGDIQPNGGGTASMSANTGQRTSIWTWSGLSGQVPVPYPGQTFALGFASNQTVKFSGVMTDNGDGTSTLTLPAPLGFTLSPGTPIPALYTHDPYLYPLVVVSGSGTSYIVTDGSGSGENQPSQVFAAGAMMIYPYGSINPNTGLPTTAYGGTSKTGYNGTYLVSGERTQASTGNWGSYSVAVGNRSTLATDVTELWMMNISGSGGAWNVGGINLGDGATCPGTQPSP